MKNEIVYRKAKVTDVDKLSILFIAIYIQTYGQDGVSEEFATLINKQFSIERLTHIITNYPENIFVAEYKNNLVGVAEIEFDKKTPVGNFVGPELNKLYILDWFCGKGIGKGLLQEAEKVVQSKGFDKLWLWVYIKNERAISFYKKNNFEWIGNAFFQMQFNEYENLVFLKKLSKTNL